MLTVKDRVQQAVSGTPGSGTVTLAAASAPYQSLGSAEDGKVIAGYFTDGSSWEVGEYTYTDSSKTLARTRVLASSSGGSTLSLSSSAVFNCELSASAATSFLNAAQSLVPGGRLTLTSNTPVTVSDVTNATNIYYTPYLNNVISLWDGRRWTPIQFSDFPFGIGTVTATVCYDIFAFFSVSTGLALESLAWTSATARATAITIQDGRYCKSGDKTRLYLGTFYPQSTTQVQDTINDRSLWNMYNRRPRKIQRTMSGANNVYNTAAFREWGGVTNRVSMVRGLDVDSLLAMPNERMTQGSPVAGAGGYLGLDAVDSSAGSEFLSVTQTGASIGAAVTTVIYPGLGYHQLVPAQYNFSGGGSPTYVSYVLNAITYA